MAQVKKDFRKHLKVLKDKRKDIIDSITKICSANAQHAKLLIEALFEEFREAKIERKLALLFLMDSILKNCKEQYQEHLEDGISDAFCDAYQVSMNKPDIRKSLRLLFKTWEPHFSGKTIMAIITNIKLTLGEDINTSLSEEELDSLIEYYRKNGIDPSHLILQKQILQKQGLQGQKMPKKSVPKEPMEEESSLYVPPDVKALLNPKQTVEKEKKVVKTSYPRPEAGQRPSAPVVIDDMRKKHDGEVPHKKSIEIEHSPRKTEPLSVPKRIDIPPAHRKLEGVAQRKMEGGESSTYTIKKRKNATDREKPPLDKAEQALGKIRKSVKPDPNHRPEIPGRSIESQYPVMGNGNGNGPGGYGQVRRTQESTRGSESSSRSFFGQQQQQQPDYEEIGNFSDGEDFQPQTKPSQRPFGHQQPPLQGQPQFQQQHHQHPSQYPSQSQSQTQTQTQTQAQSQNQPQLLHPPHTQSHFPQSQNPPQQQQFKPHHQPQQFPPQTQPHQMHPQNYPFQPQGQGQYLGQGQDLSQRSGPTQSHSQQQPIHQYPGPFSHQNPSQHYRPPIGTEQQQQHPSGRNPQPVHQMPEKNEDKLFQIKKFVEDSLRKDIDGSKPQQELDPRLAIPSGPSRVDSFPDPKTMSRNIEDNGDYDQDNVLIFKSLVQSLKRELPRAIKSKYEYRMGRMGSLSNMVARRDFRIVETIYEELPYRCSSCGMRFGNSSLLNKHLDWHFQFNMEMKEKTKTMNLRTQLITTDHWIRDEGNKNFKTAILENGEDDFEFENYVSSTEEVKNCKACGEAFKEVWDKDKEAWLLDTATKVKYEEEGVSTPKQKSSDYDLMHFRCYKLCLQIESK